MGGLDLPEIYRYGYEDKHSNDLLEQEATVTQHA